MNATLLKRLIAAMAVVALVAAFFYALREKPAFVDMATVERRPMQVTIREEGVTRVREVYTISAPIAGHLARSTLEQGDRVVANETAIAAIHPLDPPLMDWRTIAELEATRDAAAASVGIARIQLTNQQTALKLAREELDRVLKLQGPGIVAESSVQQARGKVRILEEEVRAARTTIRLREAQLESAKARLVQPDPAAEADPECCVTLQAPIDGVVLSMFAKSEQAVAVGTKIAEVGDPAALEVRADLLSSDSVRIRPGTKAVISDWGGDKDLEAEVRLIEPAAFTKVSALGIEEQRVNAVLDLREGDGRLGHGYRVFVEMVIWECGDCLQVPIGALFRQGGDWVVFVIDGDRVVRTSVAIDHLNDETAEIISGLDEGDQVVMHPGDALEDGALVTLRQ